MCPGSDLSSRFIAVATILIVLILPPAALADQPNKIIAIKNVRVFDGSRILPRVTVIIQDGTIKKVGADVAAPDGADVIDGRGSTLLPGLIDAHAHVRRAEHLKQALRFGVTTELDMFMDYRLAKEIKEQLVSGQGKDMADLRTAGTLVTAPGGHGTRGGPHIPTLLKQEDAQAFVDARIAEGSDYIKIVYDDGRTMGSTFPSLDKATLEAVVKAAHRRRRLAVVHVLSCQGAGDAIAAGTDGLVHLFVDRLPGADFVDLIVRQGSFVIPTLTILKSACGERIGQSLVADPLMAPFLSNSDLLNLEATFRHLKKAGASIDFSVAVEMVHRLKAANVPILAGTDAPGPGTVHGASLHQEMVFLVEAGLTPLEALAAATSVPARVFGLSDRGRVAPGMRADLVLVRGDPSRDIKATRDIIAIWKQGVAVDRRKRRVSGHKPETAPMHPPHPSR